MNLLVDVPQYELTIPSNGKTIVVRPFLVKEEKLLLMAVESNDNITIVNTAKQVIKNCIIEGDIDIEKLPFFDVDYLFIALRAKSVGESVDMKYTCNNETETGRCGNMFPAKIDIANVEIVKDPEIQDLIDLGGNTKVKMKYPTYTAFKVIHDNDNIINKKIRLIANSIEYIARKNTTHTMKDLTPAQVIDFIENLTKEQYNKLENFVDNFPYFVVKSKAKCNKCGFEHSIDYREFESFF